MGLVRPCRYPLGRAGNRLTAVGRGIAGRVNLLDTAKDQVRSLAGRVFDGRSSDGRSAATRQTVTVTRPVDEVDAFWRDPQRLSAAFGDLGEVRFTEPDRYRWRLRVGDEEVDWDSRLTPGNPSLRFVDDTGHRIEVGRRPAPGGRGTEVTLSADLPLPDLLAGAAVFTVLYRMRALLQTGEVPTIALNPRGH